ncbi:MAG: hypothetical protein QME88_12435 [Actinomycetota bacterium]|nr:hypothetical protein [Actinomycetota bacterium]
MVGSHDREEDHPGGGQEVRKGLEEGKGPLPDEFCALTGNDRSYAAESLKKGPPEKGKSKRGALRPVGSSRGRKPAYTAEVRRQPVGVWSILDRPCGKRPQAAMPATPAALERSGEIGITDEVREKLQGMSAS